MIRERNRLRRNVKSEPEGRKKWIDKCKEVRERIRSSKEESWKTYVDKLESSTSSREVWKTIRNLDGRYGERKDNEVLVVDGKGHVEDKDKANAFAKTYKKVSRIPRRRTTDAELKRENRRFLRNKPTEKTKWETDITMEEVERAISELANEKAAGEDEIPNEFISSLGRKAKRYLLHMFNKIWNGEEIPQMWRTALIITLLKDGKDPTLPSSYRPISLTACLGKLLEKIIAQRLLNFLETNELLNPQQAGFRSEHCTTDQILKLVQMATDTMQAKTNGGAATMLTFFDFNRAFDTVWRDGLLSKMIDMGIPYSYIKYTRAFLSARRTKVKVNGETSKEFYLNEGLPQGSSISPILFLIYINDITDYINAEAKGSLFVDDTAAWKAVGKDKMEAERKMQAIIDGVSRWARDWKMSLNSDKTEAMVISSSNKDLKWKPVLHLKGAQVKIVSEYKFLGVIIDGGLRFKSHVNRVIAKCRKRNNILRCMAGKDWGQSLETQKKLYLAYIRSAIEYASAAWYPWISKTARTRLEAVQNESLRIMTRLAKTCPKDFLRLETGTEPLKVRMEKNSSIMWEKYVRLPAEDERKKMLEKKVNQRLKTRHGWRFHTEEKMKHIQVNRMTQRKNICPMEALNVEIDEVKLEGKKTDYTTEQLKMKTEEKIMEINADTQIYTDGSTAGDQRRGGAGMGMYSKDGEEVEAKTKAAGEWASSYDAECVAMEMATTWINEQPKDDALYVILTDSHSLIQALRKNDWRGSHEWLSQVKYNLVNQEHRVKLCWIPSHCGTVGNERADELAEEGTRLDQKQAPVSCSIMKAKIRGVKWEVKHERAKETYGERRSPKWKVERSWPAEVRRLYED